MIGEEILKFGHRARVALFLITTREWVGIDEICRATGLSANSVIQAVNKLCARYPNLFERNSTGQKVRFKGIFRPGEG